MNRYFQLLQTWCDRLIDVQIRELKDPSFYGGILCPACVSIHGRMGDAVYPFTFLYDKTGDPKYLEAAKLVVNWSEANVLRSNGGYFNDKSGIWMGISVFSAISLGDTLYYHGDCLDQETRDSWFSIFLRLIEFVYEFFGRDTMETNVNYYSSECHAMALAYRLTGNEKYKERAYQEAKNVTEPLTEDGLLIGEGLAKPKVQKRGLFIKQRTEGKNCGFVDIGYNVEESLPSLTAFAHYMDDEKFLQICAQLYKAHLDFLLPDGAWDNSFGARADKWTYWGSRTSDGAQVGLCYLAKLDPVFAKAAHKNFELYERCSANGYLYGGLMYIEADEEPCVHHSFCHAKALCAMMDSGFTYDECEDEQVALPREIEYGVKYFPTAHVHLISKNNFRATICDSDALIPESGKGTTGGTMTMLWHQKTGPVFAATMAEFKMAETRNMQFSRRQQFMPNIAPRITSDAYQSVNDIHAEVSVSESNDCIHVTANGVLRNIQLESNQVSYCLQYLFEGERLTIQASATEDCRFHLPVICSKDDPVDASANEISVNRKGAMIRLTSSAEQQLEIDGEVTARDFHVIGGFLTLPVFVELKANVPYTVTIEIQ